MSWTNVNRHRRARRGRLGSKNEAPYPPNAVPGWRRENGCTRLHARSSYSAELVAPVHQYRAGVKVVSAFVCVCVSRATSTDVVGN